MKIIGHRGARGLAPENTLASLQKALSHGVDELEFDVRVTKDNIPVLNHDPMLTDANGAKVVISDSPYELLKAHKPDLVSLREVFNTLERKAQLRIEVKPNVKLQPIIAIIQKELKKEWKSENISLGSKSQKTLRALHEAFPDVEKVVIERWSGVKARLRARQVDTKQLSMQQWWLWSGFLLGMSRAGYKVVAYTLNDPKKAQRWAKYGLYGVITDFPDRFQP